MQAHSYQTFVSMFYALDAAFEENDTERLRTSRPRRIRSFRKTRDRPILRCTRSSRKPLTNVRDSGGCSRGYDGIRPGLSRARNGEYCWVEGDLVAAFDGIVTPQLWEQSLEETAD